MGWIHRTNMKYQCPSCGAILTEDELATVEESRGEFWGVPCWESINVCPMCGEIPEEYCEPFLEGEEE